MFLDIRSIIIIGFDVQSDIESKITKSEFYTELQKKRRDRD